MCLLAAFSRLTFELTGLNTFFVVIVCAMQLLGSRFLDQGLNCGPCSESAES